LKKVFSPSSQVSYILPLSILCGFVFSSIDFFLLTGVLEHFNIFCWHLGRREDKAGKEDCTAILKYCEQI